MNPRALSYRQREPCWVMFGRANVWWQAPEKPIKRQEKTEKPIPWWAWLIALWLVLALIRKLLT